MSARLFLAVAGIAAFLAAFGAVAGLGASRHANALTDGAAWSVGRTTDGSNFLRPTGSTVLVGNAANATFQGNRIVEAGRDGNFEFEHAYGNVESRFDARTAAGAATPMQIGLADGQNVTALIVPGTSRQAFDIQSWGAGATPPSGIDRYGRLRIDGIALFPLLRNGRVRLYAVLPNGTVQYLRPVATR